MNKNIAIFGLGKTGISATKYLLNKGCNLFIYDDNLNNSPEKIEQLRKGTSAQDTSILDTYVPDTLIKDAKQNNLTIAAPESYDWQQMDYLILSAGIPLTHPTPHKIVEMAQQANCPIICDVEQLYNDNPQAHYIAITGTNGKSTTTALISHIANELNQNTNSKLRKYTKWFMGGNIGIAAIDLPQDKNAGYVIEMSSYQLDLTHKTKFNIAILLNITADHIDRHGDIQGYAKAKKRIFNNQSSTDYAVICIDDKNTRAIYNELKNSNDIHAQNLISISTDIKALDVTPKNIVPKDSTSTTYIKADIIVNNNIIYDTLLGKELQLPDLPYLRGEHNMQNIAAAYSAMKFSGYNENDIIKHIQSFTGLEHRMQIIAKFNNIQFINDSKATNAIATQQALNSYNNIYWIAGGVSKEGGIEQLSTFFKNIHHVFLIGKASDEFALTLDKYNVEYSKCENLKNATNMAYELASHQNTDNQNETTILLSPSCASFDQFKNFEERGNAFCNAVNNLKYYKN